MKNWTDAINNGGLADDTWYSVEVPSASTEYVSVSFSNCTKNKFLAKISFTVTILKSYYGSDTVSTIIPTPDQSASINSELHIAVLNTNSSISIKSVNASSSNTPCNKGEVSTFTDVIYSLKY